MPPKKYQRKRVYRKKKIYRKKTTGMALKVPKPRVMPFGRNMEYLLSLENPSNGWIQTLDNALVKTFDFNLAELPNFTDFTNLFSQYKLNMAILKIYPSASQVVVSTAAAGTQNMIITVWANTHGNPLTAVFQNSELLEIQRKKAWMFPMNKPTSIKMPLRQLTNTYAGTLNTDYATVRPRYISTTETSTPHYGMNVHIRKMDGTAFGSNSARLLIRQKIYLTCKQVS